MENEFDKIARELIGKKEYAFNKSLWAKANIGVKAAYTKIIIIKSAIALSAASVVSVLGVVYFQNHPVAPTEMAQTPIAIEEQIDDVLTKSTKTIERFDLEISDGMNYPKPEVVQPEPPINTPKKEYPKSPKVSNDKSSIKTNKKSFARNTDEEVSVRKQFEPHTLKVFAYPFLEDLKNEVKPQLNPIPIPPNAMSSRGWRIELYVSNGTPLIRDNFPMDDYRTSSSNSQCIGINFEKRTKSNWAFGSGLRKCSFNETRVFTRDIPEEITHRFLDWKLDSTFLGRGVVFNNATGTWEATDSTFEYDWIPFYDETTDTIWARRTEHISNQIKTVEIPFSLSYALQRNRWTLRPSVSTGIGYMYSVNYAHSFGPNQEIQAYKSSDIKSFYLNYTAEANLEYRLAYRNFISGGIGFSQSSKAFGNGVELDMVMENVYYKVGLGFKF